MHWARAEYVFQSASTLPFSKDNFEIEWITRRGGSTKDIFKSVSEKLIKCSSLPDYLLVHVGTNDLQNLTTVNQMIITKSAFSNLEKLYLEMSVETKKGGPPLAIRKRFIWSEIISRVNYGGKGSASEQDGLRRKLNRSLRGKLGKSGIGVVTHMEINRKDLILFRLPGSDGVHLSRSGH